MRPKIETLLSQARLLERIECGRVFVGAEEYRLLVCALRSTLALAWQPALLAAVMKHHPAVAELYENIHYELSGLSQSPTTLAVESELRARDELQRISATARTIRSR
jgi:hypothetical protein